MDELGLFQARMLTNPNNPFANLCLWCMGSVDDMLVSAVVILAVVNYWREDNPSLFQLLGTSWVIKMPLILSHRL